MITYINKLADLGVSNLHFGSTSGSLNNQEEINKRLESITNHLLNVVDKDALNVEIKELKALGLDNLNVGVTDSLDDEALVNVQAVALELFDSLGLETTPNDKVEVQTSTTTETPTATTETKSETDAEDDSDSSDDDSSDSSENQETPVKKAPKLEEEEEEKAAPVSKKKQKKPNQPFRRVKSTGKSFSSNQWDASQYGDHGREASEKLGKVQGKDFTKAKNKRKRSNRSGFGSISMSVNSIDLTKASKKQKLN